MKTKTEVKEMKPISYYTFETAKITILWHGKIQPVGRFKSATEALRFVEVIAAWSNTASEYQLNCDGEIINVSDYIK